MDINFIRAELMHMVDREEDFVQQRIHILIDRLDGELEIQNNSSSVITDVLAVVEGYNTTYTALLAEYSSIPLKETTNRINKIHEILCTLSALSTYLVSSCAQYFVGTLEDMSPVAKYVNALKLKKEYYMSEKIVWQSLLKSLTQEMVLTSEKIKYRTMELRNEVLIKENS